MGANHTTTLKKVTKDMSSEHQERMYSLFTENEIRIIFLLFKDLSINSENSGVIKKSAFLKFTELPGVIGQRAYRYSTARPDEGLNFDEFINLIAKFTKTDGEEMVEALFQIFDTDNDGFFDIEDLITLLRTFEVSGVVPELRKETPGFNIRLHKNLSDDYTGSPSGSTKSIAT